MCTKKQNNQSMCKSNQKKILKIKHMHQKSKISQSAEHMLGPTELSLCPCLCPCLCLKYLRSNRRVTGALLSPHSRRRKPRKGHTCLLPPEIEQLGEFLHGLRGRLHAGWDLPSEQVWGSGAEHRPVLVTQADEVGDRRLWLVLVQLFAVLHKQLSDV